MREVYKFYPEEQSTCRPGLKQTGRDEAARPPLNWPTILFISGTTAAAALWPLYAYHYGVTAGQRNLVTLQ